MTIELLFDRVMFVIICIMDFVGFFALMASDEFPYNPQEMHCPNCNALCESEKYPFNGWMKCSKCEYRVNLWRKRK